MDQAHLVDSTQQSIIVRIKGFHKTYGRHHAVEGLDLEIKAGEFYGLIGPDGAGKSSLMKAVAGVLSFDAGEVNVFGVHIDSERSAEKIKQHIGFMPQGLGLNLYPELSVEENIDFFARLRMVSEKDLKERKDRLLNVTRLAPFRNRPMKNLSGGMKQKLGLVCSLVHEPDLVILDEPTTGVDPVSRRDFWAILAQLLRERRMTALVSTAYMEEASRFHRVSLLHEGSIIAQGEPDAILALAPGVIVTVRTDPQTKALELLKTRFSQVQVLGPSLRVFVENADEEKAIRLIQEILSGMHLPDIRTYEPELEDVFLSLLREQQPSPSLTRAEAGVTFTASRRSSSPPENTAIQATDLTRNFGPFRAVDHVNFRVPYGEIFGLLGANGAGKTTVIKMLTGILQPSSGLGHVAGADMRTASQSIKEHIGYMSQAFSLYQDLTVTENIRLYAGIYGLSRSETRDRTRWIIEMAGLHGNESDQAGSLPMGLRQRLALGCALVHRPRVLFLDEPTSGVDPLGRRRLWDIFFHLSREENVAILVTTHYMSEAEHCDHLALMFAGRLVADDSPEGMKRQLEKEAGGLLDISADPSLTALELCEKSGFEGVALYGKHIHLLAKDPVQAEERIRHAFDAGGVKLLSISRCPLTMEDVFVTRILALEKEQEKAR